MRDNFVEDDCYVTALNHFAEDDAYVSLTAVERDKYINVDTPKVYSGPTSSESEVVGGTFETDSEWKDFQFIVKDPEPEVDLTDYWARGDRDLNRVNESTLSFPYLCDKCRARDQTNEWNESGDNVKFCVNCNFNFWCRLNQMFTIEQEKNYIWESAPSPDWNRILPADDLKKFVIKGALLLSKRPVP